MARTDLKFDAPGTLPRPGPIGRLYRLFMAAICLFVVGLVWRARDPLLAGDADTFASLILPIVFGIFVVNYVINIGFGISLGRLPQFVSIGAAIIAAASGQLLFGSASAPPLGLYLAFWLAYLYTHLGLSFLLATLLGTPGCEMRAFADLGGHLKGVRAAEHHCPVGIMQPLDNWEARQSWMRPAK